MITTTRRDRELAREYMATGRDESVTVLVTIGLPVLLRKDRDLLVAHIRTLAEAAISRLRADCDAES